MLVGRGALRNPWIFSADRRPAGRPAGARRDARGAGPVSDRVLDLLLTERVGEAEGFRHVAPGVDRGAESPAVPARGRERWVINKLRALGSWYTKGFENGSHLRVAINSAESIPQLRGIIERFFFETQPGYEPRTSQASAASVIS